MISIIDPGHKYKLLCLDGGQPSDLIFVKRHDEDNPGKFPGNTESYPGTTIQSVLRAVHDRLSFLQKQIPCDENIAIMNNIRDSLYLLEHRAARRHGLETQGLTQHIASFGEMCEKCGHTICNCHAH